MIELGEFAELYGKALEFFVGRGRPLSVNVRSLAGAARLAGTVL